MMTWRSTVSKWRKVLSFRHYTESCLCIHYMALSTLWGSLVCFITCPCFASIHKHIRNIVPEILPAYFYVNVPFNLRNVVELEGVLDRMGWCNGKNVGLSSQDNRVRISNIQGCPDCGVLLCFPSRCYLNNVILASSITILKFHQ
jgi:hypothetical protein